MSSLASLRSFATLALIALLACLCFAQKKDEKPASRGEEVEDVGLILTIPQSFQAKRLPRVKDTQIAASWSGTCGNSNFQLEVRSLPLEQFHFDQPLDVLNVILENMRNERPGFAFDEQRTLPGPFGIVPYAICARAQFQEPGATKTGGVEFYLCATTDKVGYVIEMKLEPMPDAAALETAHAFLAKGIAWKGKPRDPKWTKEEVEARWNKDVSDPKKNKLDKVLRTEHYIILTNSSGGKNFAEKMEECYTKIKATFAFEEMPSERLMPVFLFRNPEEYFGFFAKQFSTTVEQARRSKGVAFRDFYATWYEAPNDPVHIHEGTHQIFANRLQLGGGGSWFQEGVAEYMCTAPNDRNTAARNVKKGRQMPIAEFMKVESLLFSSKTESKSGDDEAASQYELAAFLIEFVRESKFSKDHFVDWFHAIGETARNNVPAIEAATKKTLGVDLKELEAQWVEYAKKR